MTEQEEKRLAERVAEGSEVFDFERALELVQRMPADAEKLIRIREETKEWQEKLDRAYQGLHRAAQAMQ
jgi:Ni,Fe-hydrogenase III small subunit